MTCARLALALFSLTAGLAGCGTRSAQLPSARDGSAVPPPPTRDLAGDTLPDVCKAWSCWQSQGRSYCHNPQSPGLPAIGFWSCHLLMPPRRPVPTWRCDGAVPRGGLVETLVPCASSWSCSLWGDDGVHDVYRCEKPDDALDRPPPELTQGKQLVCIKGSSWGTRCELLDSAPTIPPLWLELSDANNRCRPGTKLWCDDGQVDGWGLVTCRADGRWPTVNIQGRAVLDCQRRSDGRVPDTACACYFRLFADPSCCERADCLLPEGSDGRICEPDSGDLCAACVPYGHDTCGAGVCLVNEDAESYCTRPCSGSGSGDCPADFDCTLIPDLGTRQCIPTDRSCYF